MSRRRRRRTIEQRYDAMRHTASGRGTSADKLSGLTAYVEEMHPQTSREWYLANGFVQNIVDAPAEDATREWITIRTNRDEDLGISRMIENRLAELAVQQRIRDLIRASRLYSRGGLLYFGVLADAPQNDAALREPLPSDVDRLDFVNIISPEHVSIMDASFDPLSKLYHEKRFMVMGKDVHRSRIEWMVHSLVEEEKRGVSVIETILDAIKAQDTAVWSVTTLLFEMSIKVIKSDQVTGMAPEKMAEFVSKIRAVLNTQSTLALGETESLERVEVSGVADSGLRQIFDFIFDNIAGLARIPKSRLMGQAQGVITAGQYDLLSYYDTVAKFQELEVRPILEKIINIIVHERQGKISKALNGAVETLDWEFDFNPLWKMAPMDEADRKLKEAQTDQIYVTIGVLSPNEVKQERFEELEKFDEWQEPQLDLRHPALAIVPPKPDEKNAENDKPQNTAFLAT